MKYSICHFNSLFLKFLKRFLSECSLEAKFIFSFKHYHFFLIIAKPEDTNEKFRSMFFKLFE